jgi:DnaJ family protein C protein 2
MNLEESHSPDDLLYLPEPPENHPSKPVVICLPAEALQVLKIEPAGRAYEQYLPVLQGIRPLDHNIVTKNQKEEENEQEEEDDKDDEKEDDKYSHHKKKSIESFTENYYDLLDLGEKGWRATADDIKKAFRHAALKYHPDKLAASGMSQEEATEMFKKVNLAHDVLSDPKKRRAYDSQEPFDDTIPKASDIETDEEFFSVFSDVFQRNSKWSRTIKTPPLGSMKSNWNEVDRFYKFWYDFRSWRDFSYLDEYDPEEAESREEKRWMEKKNAKHRQKKEREEQARINNLVDLAYKLDPRIRKRKEEEQKEKERKKQQRAELSRQKWEEEERKRAEARQKEEEAQQKIKQEEEQKRLELKRINNQKKTTKSTNQTIGSSAQL